MEYIRSWFGGKSYGNISSTIPIISEVGCWKLSKVFQTQQIEVKVVKQPGSPLNPTAVVEVQLTGEFKPDQPKMKPFMKALHVCQKFVLDKEEHQVAHIEITPIVDSNQDTSFSGGSIPFQHFIQISISSWKYGDMKVQITCQGITKEAIIQQHK